ncbi:hypothetical protein B566_EDAN007948 [Ephemera danica]|nr:hypothetical protein B566_EDAN007948 [Ephemera danica]
MASCTWDQIISTFNADRFNHGTALDSTVNTYFHEHDGVYKPRSVFIDLDDGPINELLSGPLKGIVDADSCVIGSQQATGIFAMRFADEYIEVPVEEPALEVIRREVEKCDCIQGFMFCHSYGGGTGSGLTSLLMVDVEDHFGKVEMYSVGIYAAFEDMYSTEIYNAVLGLYTEMVCKNVGPCFVFQNEALRKICKDNEIDRPNHEDLNFVIGNVMSSIAAGAMTRAESTVDIDNLSVRFPSHPYVKFPLISFTRGRNDPRIRNVAAAMLPYAFASEKQVVCSDPLSGRIASICNVFLGGVTANDARGAVNELYAGNMHLVTRNSLGVNTSVPAPPTLIGDGYMSMQMQSDKQEVSLCTFSTNTAIISLFKNAEERMRYLLNRNAFVHYYESDGIESEDLFDAYYSLEDIIMEYSDLHNILLYNNNGQQ